MGEINLNLECEEKIFINLNDEGSLNMVMAVEEEDLKVLVGESGDLNLVIGESSGDLNVLIQDSSEDMKVVIGDDSNGINLKIGGEFTTFILLSDTPTTYVGQAGKTVRVNSSEDGLEFIDGGSLVQWGEITGTLSDQLDLQAALDLKYDAADFNSDFDARLATKDTDDLAEGSNLYYTEARVSANSDVAANTTHRSSDGKDHSDVVLNNTHRGTVSGNPHNVTLADVGGTTDHTQLINIGTNTHVQIDTHLADLTIHFTEGSISHLNIQDIGSNSHANIDSHIADSTIHFTEASIDHLNIQNIGSNSHATIDTHLADSNIHFSQSSLDPNQILHMDSGGNLIIGDTNFLFDGTKCQIGTQDHGSILNLGDTSLGIYGGGRSGYLIGTDANGYGKFHGLGGSYGTFVDAANGMLIEVTRGRGTLADPETVFANSSLLKYDIYGVLDSDGAVGQVGNFSCNMDGLTPFQGKWLFSALEPVGGGNNTFTVAIGATTFNTALQDHDTIFNDDTGENARVDAGLEVFKFSKGILKPISTKTNNYTILQTDHTILLDGTSNSVTATLPVSPNTGQIFIIKCINDTNITDISRNGKNIDGVASDITLIRDEVVTLQYDGTGWFIL